MDRTTVQRIDDMDRESPADERVRFGLDGKRFVIDLTGERAKELRARLAPYIDAARRDDSPARSAASSGRSSGSSGSSAERQERERIRAWARSQNIDVPARGRIPRSVRERYAASH